MTVKNEGKEWDWGSLIVVQKVFSTVTYRNKSVIETPIKYFSGSGEGERESDLKTKPHQSQMPELFRRLTADQSNAT